MTDDWMSGAAEHPARIVVDLLRVHAVCACGWVGGPEETEHDALSGHAAHVHVATVIVAAQPDAPDPYNWRPGDES